MDARTRKVLGAALLVAASFAAIVAIAGVWVSPAGLEAFPADVREALLSGAVAQDALWSPAARNPGLRMLDARTASLFAWSNVRTEGIIGVDLPPGPSGARRIAVEVRTRGTATWLPRAWGIATNFWTLQADEMHEVSAVTRREQWALEESGGRWLAVERRLLGQLELIEAQLVVDVHPKQDVLLVEGSYYVRSKTDSLRAVRFLVDRRASFYDFRVDGESVEVIRGNELGSLGLEGFSPELESSFAFPKPLGNGEEALITFRLRAPVVHMSGPGFVTSVPCRDGPFRERLWIPILAPWWHKSHDRARIDFALRWTAKEFDRVALAGSAFEPAVIATGDEASSVHAEWTGDLQDVDFLLLAPGADPEQLGLPIRWTAAELGQLARFERTDPLPQRVLPAGRRERAVVVRPLLEASYAATQDFGNELQELLPLDDDVLNELSDESSTDAESGADDRSAN